MEFLSAKSKRRINQSFRCLAFNLNFYKDAQERGLNAQEVFINQAYYGCKGRLSFQSSEGIEDSFRWLIRIGVLRREVDGQGLTSKIRLTPLGRQIIEQNPNIPDQKASHLEKITQLIHRNCPFI